MVYEGTPLMFYFKITVRSKNGDGPRKSRNLYGECLSTDEVGKRVATKLRLPATTSVSVTRISQAHFIRATRPGA